MGRADCRCAADSGLSGTVQIRENSGSIIPNPADGAEILHEYVQYTFGNYGSFFLAVLIFVACMVTAIGLTCACAEFFSRYLPISYRTLVWILGAFSMVISNLGLSKLIAFSIPVLVSIYPPCIVLILLSFTLRFWKNGTGGCAGNAGQPDPRDDGCSERH